MSSARTNPPLCGPLWRAGQRRGWRLAHERLCRIISRRNILSSHPPAARTKLLRIMKVATLLAATAGRIHGDAERSQRLQEKGVAVREGCSVESVQEGRLVLAGSASLDFDECLWCTQAGAPDWFQDTGLPVGRPDDKVACQGTEAHLLSRRNRTSVAALPERLICAADERGFITIGETLQCRGGPDNVFAVGDCATSAVYPRPKAGVFAVRQGPPLISNLRRCAYRMSAQGNGSDWE